MKTEVGYGLVIDITPYRVDTEPSLNVWQVEIYDATSSWRETYPTTESLQAFLRGFEAGAAMIGKKLTSRPEIPHVNDF